MSQLYKRSHSQINKLDKSAFCLKKGTPSICAILYRQKIKKLWVVCESKPINH